MKQLHEYRCVEYCVKYIFIFTRLKSWYICQIYFTIKCNNSLRLLKLINFHLKKTQYLYNVKYLNIFVIECMLIFYLHIEKIPKEVKHNSPQQRLYLYYTVKDVVSMTAWLHYPKIWHAPTTTWLNHDWKWQLFTQITTRK